MKRFSKISSVIMVAAVVAGFTSISRADDIVIKPLRHQPPAKSLFTEKVKVAPVVTCAACRDELVPTATQDTKLKTKTVLIAKHGCPECKTTLVRTGAQKATGKVVREHTCGAMLAAVNTCCGGMK